MTPATRVKFAWFLLVASLIGWPLSLFWWAADEPPFVLSLSWLALTLTALDVLFTADVRREQDEDTAEVVEASCCPHCGEQIAA